MKLFKTLFDFYINSSIHVAISVVSLSIITHFYFSIPLQVNLLLFIFFSSITGYNLVKYAELAGFRHFSLPFELRSIQILSLFCFMGMIFFASKQSVIVLVSAAILGLLTFIYAMPFISKSNLRNVAGLKIFLISMVWAGTTVILPILNTDVAVLEAGLEFIQRFIFILVLMIPFEIRDLKRDETELGTLPQMFGVKKTRYVGLIMIFFMIVLEWLKMYGNPSYRMIFLAIGIICLMMIMRADKDQKPYFASFWVEGIPILWLGIMLVFKTLS